MGFFDRLRKRSNPQSTVSMLSHSDFGIIIDGDGYVPLARNPDVILAVNKIADMVSNMTIHLMENTDKGDIRIKDGLARKIDINPCAHMTRKTWIFKIVRDLLLYGDGNSVVAPHMGAWIEINTHLNLSSDISCRTPHGCVD